MQPQRQLFTSHFRGDHPHRQIGNLIFRVKPRPLRHFGRQPLAQGIYAMAALGIEDDALRQRLMDIYMRLDAYPEVKDVLSALKAGGIKTAVLSNGSPEMLSSAVDNAGIADLLDDVFSVDSIGVYKPHPSVYQMAVDGLGVDAARICFMSSNAWDAAAGANFGYRVVWVNRFGQPQERIPGEPEHEVKTLEALPPLLGL